MATQVNRGLAFATRIDIPEALRLKLVELLNARLADAFDLYEQLRQGHGNVKSADFIQGHELYDAIAESVLKREVQPASRPLEPLKGRHEHRFNRRASKARGLIFYRLLVQCLNTRPPTTRRSCSRGAACAAVYAGRHQSRGSCAALAD